jgi:hypothetical protein
MTKEIYEVGLRTPTALNIHIRKVLAVTMASKTIYWKCSDCNSMINDENMHEIDWVGPIFDTRFYAEFCYGCKNYDPEVVIAYA